MSDIAIKVENLSKLYQIGGSRSGSLKETLNSFYSKRNNATNDFWALNDVSFEIKKGEAIGVVGKNGAGKSTLLKILSRITEPSKGRIEINGRVSSLLEVGTGFHPELTGKENVYLNGTILGMTRKEVKLKFDEIVDFSGVEKFINTPVKHYSSGMYVRLAFAVAAHLEPEILIIDEVLAVGDAEFQKKCLGKMEEVSKNFGRTILFVSHNMTAVKTLCEKSLLLYKGEVDTFGESAEVIDKYFSFELKNQLVRKWTLNDAEGIDSLKVIFAEIMSTADLFKVTQPLFLKFSLYSYENQKVHLSLVLKTQADEIVFNVLSNIKKLDKGENLSVLEIPGDLLNDGRYFIDLYIIDSNKIVPLFKIENILIFDIIDERENLAWVGKWIGVVRPKLKFEII